MQKSLFIVLSRVEAIASVAKEWLRKDSPWMYKAEKILPARTGYSKQMLRACLERTFRPYSEASMLDWVNRVGIENCFGNYKPGKNKILIISPSTVFAAPWQAAVHCWLSGYAVTIRPSSHEPDFATLLARSVSSITGNILKMSVLDPQRSINFEPFRKVIIYGSDETVEKIHNRMPKKTKLIGFGSKFSISVVDRGMNPNGEIQSIIKSAAIDAALYKGQGCLSPQCFFIKTKRNIDATKFAESLGKELLVLDRKLPTLTNEPRKIESLLQHWTFRASQKKAEIFSNRVILDQTKGFNPAGLPGIVFVKTFSSYSELPKQLGNWCRKISTISFCEGSEEYLKKAFHRFPSIRFCPVGQMHEPPPDWKNGGIDLIRELTH